MDTACTPSTRHAFWHLLITAAVGATVASTACTIWWLHLKQDRRVFVRGENLEFFKEIKINKNEIPINLDISSNDGDDENSKHKPEFKRVGGKLEPVAIPLKNKMNKMVHKLHRRSSERRTNKPKPRHSTQRSNSQVLSHRKMTQVSAMHFVLTMPALPENILEKIRNENHTEKVDFGFINTVGFIPSARHINATLRYPLRNWEISENSLLRSSKAFQYEKLSGEIEILRSGIYYVYSQIRFYHKSQCSYALIVNNDIFLKCIEGCFDSELWQYSNCNLGGARVLKQGDRVWLQNMYGDMDRNDLFIHLDPDLHASSYWGAILLDDG